VTRTRKSLTEVFKASGAAQPVKPEPFSSQGRLRQVNALVDEDLALEAASKAKREGRKIKEVVAELLAMYVDGRVILSKKS
jgi:hypothetical protein